MNYKLTDTAIAQIAKCIQMAILTGTDIVDHLRQLEFETNDNYLQISTDTAAQFNDNISRMIEEAQALQSPVQQKLFE